MSPEEARGRFASARVTADGSGRVLESSPGAVALLRERYAQYRDTPPEGPVLAVDVRRWSGWHG